MKKIRKKKEGLDVRGGFFEEMDLQLDLERLRNEIISGEEVENTLDFEAQRMAFFVFFFFSPLPFLAFRVDKKQPPQAKLFFFLEDVTSPEGTRAPSSFPQRPHCG